MNKTYKKTIWKSFIDGVNTYELLKDKDRPAVLLTGDFHSLLLLLLLEELKSHGKISFTPLYFSTIPERAYSHFQLKTTVAPVRDREEFLSRAKKEGCNKMVETIYFEEVAESILTQLLHHGCIQAVLPKEKQVDGYEVIRPLYLVKEEHIRQWEEGLPKDVICFFKHEKEMSGLIKGLSDRNPKIIKNIVKSVENVHLDTIISYQLGAETVHFLDRYNLTDL